ncbi:ribose/xylose/arabinose/galactoside ABC-type transport system permease subunit [Metabacillus crassostreae]|uniref:ABC transporter permease subunit n=1 Tax=Metabacillus crassostreae TaxID=929098 RepID=UPI0023BA8B55|nr:hypothetical protein [Metabacillus crassostreae]MBM7602306.1 ribose/xylose/arabinose/galactoside ABC-type transport system permease subunit [Metabacillus crassostreae]
MLSKTKFGKYTYAIGGNEQAARICGINIERYKIMINIYVGLLAAIAGMRCLLLELVLVTKYGCYV